MCQSEINNVKLLLSLNIIKTFVHIMNYGDVEQTLSVNKFAAICSIRSHNTDVYLAAHIPVHHSWSGALGH